MKDAFFVVFIAAMQPDGQSQYGSWFKINSFLVELRFLSCVFLLNVFVYLLFLH